MNNPSPRLASYLALFRQHLNQLRVHLSRNGTTQEDNHSPTVINGVEWELSEKDAFFHALSVYSRFRPDLIAASIETKNEVEVLEYIALLERASQKNAQEDLCRKNLPLAHEVSDAWITWEEENAERLCLHEEIWTEGGANDSGGVSRLMDGSLSNVPYLTYDHLVVIDSIIEADTKEVDNGTVSSGCRRDSTGSIAEVEPIVSIRSLQSNSSPILSGSPRFPKNPVPISLEQGHNPSGDDLPSSRDMSPRSRRLYQKRMYMRRKRAKTIGGEADKTTKKLRPGSRRKFTQDRTKLAKSNIVGTESAIAVNFIMSKSQNCEGGVGCISESNVDGGSPCSMPAPRLPSQIARSDFHNCHVDAESIVAAGLHIFNHGKIGKLLRLFISGHEPQLMSKDASIRTELLFLLFEILKDFLVQVISQVIILEEEHHRFRGRTKVWRKNLDEAQHRLISKSAIQFVLKTMGIINQGIDQYFADLAGEHLDPDICPPYFHFISGHNTADQETNDLMDVDSDDDRFDDVLYEEEILDEEEILIDKTHEDTLWNKVPMLK